MALSLCPAVNALARRGRGWGLGLEPEVFQAAERFSLLLNVIMRCWPEVCPAVMATAGGRSAALHAFRRFEVRTVL